MSKNLIFRERKGARMKGLASAVLYGDSLARDGRLPEFPGAPVRVSGTFGGAKAAFSVTEDALSKHTLLVGGTGTGKTNLFYHFVDQIKGKLGKNDVMIIFDSKGDFHKKFFGAGDAVLGNSAQYRAASAKWDLYREIIADGKDRQSVTQSAQELCKAFFAERVEGNNSNPFFPNAARDLLAAMIVALIRGGATFSNRDLRDYLDATPADDIRALLAKHRDLSSVASYIAGKSGSQTQGVLSEMYSVTRDIFTGVFADAGDFSMREFVRAKGGRTVFMEYDLAIGDALAPVYTLLFDLALKEALGRAATQGNVYLVADELKLLPRLRHLDDGINFGRGLGVKILAGLQSIDQLNASYGNEARARNVIAGFSSIYAFRSNDPNTREYVSRLFGRNMLLEHYQGADGAYRDDKREGFTVEDWELLSLGVGEAVVGLPFAAPFRFQFELYK
jgi:type IV secretory pathway TraG/TraD family ATPase VirD4